MANISVDGVVVGGQGARETATTASTLSAYLTSEITSTAAQAYILPAPIAGLLKTIIKTSSSTAVQTASATLGGTTSTIGLAGVTLTFTLNDQSITLLGLSGTKWQVISNVGSVTVS